MREPWWTRLFGARASGTFDRAPEVAPSLDVSSVPLAEVANMLRFIGQQLVIDVLTPSARRGRPAPDLGRLILSAPNLGSLAAQLQQDTHPAPGTLRRGVPRSVDGPTRPEGESIGELVATYVEDGLRTDAFDRAQRHYLQNRLGLSSYVLLPNILWSLAGIVAWTDLDFQYEAAYAARRFLLTYTLFTADDATEPVFAPGACWALIAQTAFVPSSLPTSETIPTSWVSNAVTELRRSALQVALLKDWAKPWDCWLLELSFRAWQSDSDEQRSQLQAVCKQAGRVSSAYG